MVELFIGNKNYSSWSLRPWLLMRELGIPFVERLMPFSGNGEQSGFKTFSPTAKVPCLVDGPTRVWDSLGITEYLAERNPRVWPADAAARAWARCASAEMHSGFQGLRSVCSMNCGVRVRLGPISSGLARDIARLDELWNEGLSRFGGPFLAGSAFTAVDAFFAPVAFRVQSYAPPLAPNSLEYVERLLSLPAMQDWYAAALREPWRDASHEDEVRDAGTVIEDFRAQPTR